MTWIIPGQPYEVEVDGKKLMLKPLTVAGRKVLATAVEDRENDSNDLEPLYDKVIAQIDSIPDYDGDIVEYIKHQSVETLLNIYRTILSGGSLSGDDSKNSDSSSDGVTSDPARIVLSAEPEDAST